MEMGDSSSASHHFLQLWNQLLICSDVLCRQCKGSNEEDTGVQLVIPHTLHKEILTDLQNGVLGGHLGVEKTLTKVM